MSPVFRHGKLRLYLLKLLDEAPRHGYEVIRLLQDRFMGVYAPSPGTIYPRLARLEEEGLVTHEEVDGKKVYSITDKGREEIRSRLGDLADLEEELTESLRDVAREISVDVRDTVRTIREELASAAREFRMHDSGTGDRVRRGKSEWAGWQEWAGKDWASRDWPGKEWTRGKGWGGGWGHGGDATTGTEDATTGTEDATTGTADTTAGTADATAGTGPKSRRDGPNPLSDLERLAIQFANELRAAARETGTIGERSLNDLRDILTDTLAKVRDEVFGGKAGPGPEAQDSGGDDASTPEAQPHPE